jgi:type IV secretory pathway protease TraF
MRCRRCKFENIPGQETCIKCGSALEIKSTAINIYPPRMAKWKKPFRDLLRSMRKGKVVPQTDIKSSSSARFKEFFSDSVSGLFLSIIPGFAHWMQNRFKEIRWYFFAWAVLLLSGLFLYGSPPGFICFGLAIGVHAAIALQYGIIKDLTNIAEKIVTVILVLIGLTFLYRLIPRMPFLNFTGGHSSLTIPYHNLEAGDYLLARDGLDENDLLQRGSLVLIRPATFRGYGRRGLLSGNDTVIGEIVGLPGEKLQIINDVFIVDGKLLDVEQYPVPMWLRRVPFSATIPNDSYFVSTRYSVRAHGVQLTASHIKQVCVLKKNLIEAKAFMKWWPLSRRGFLK